MEGNVCPALPSLLTSDSCLILTAVDHNLNFHIFKCFEYPQWFVNAKKYSSILTVLSPIHAQLNQSIIIWTQEHSVLQETKGSS